MNENNLRNALLQVIDERIGIYDEKFAFEPEHIFSKRYEKRKNNIIRVADRTRKYLPVKFSLHRAGSFIAAIILVLAMTTTVLAIVKPEIFYLIKNKIIEWEIRFEQENADTEKPLEYIRPTLPKEYELVDEVVWGGGQELTYEDKASDKWIDFSQGEPKGVTIGVDAEHGKFEKEIYNGNEILAWHLDDASMLIFNDGNYVYTVSGNCDPAILYGVIDEIIEKNK